MLIVKMPTFSTSHHDRRGSCRSRDGWSESKLRGRYGYYGIIGNCETLSRFFEGVKSTWRKWLPRPRQKAHMDWNRMVKLLQRHQLPQPRILRSYTRP